MSCREGGGSGRFALDVTSGEPFGYILNKDALLMDTITPVQSSISTKPASVPPDRTRGHQPLLALWQEAAKILAERRARAAVEGQARQEAAAKARIEGEQERARYQFD